MSTYRIWRLFYIIDPLRRKRREQWKSASNGHTKMKMTNVTSLWLQLNWEQGMKYRQWEERLRKTRERTKARERVCVSVCVCVSGRERESERENCSGREWNVLGSLLGHFLTTKRHDYLQSVAPSDIKVRTLNIFQTSQWNFWRNNCGNRRWRDYVSVPNPFGMYKKWLSLAAEERELSGEALKWMSEEPLHQPGITTILCRYGPLRISCVL
jgi:hypothetical protein